jgi:hypothetical protein
MRHGAGVPTSVSYRVCYAADKIKQDKDFGILNDRADFFKLVADLEHHEKKQALRGRNAEIDDGRPERKS